MKMYLKKALSALCCMLLCATLYAQNKVGEPSGSWSYSAPDAPYGYQEGSFQFDKKDGKLTAVVDINGSKLTIGEIKKEAGVYKCSLYVDGSSVNLTIKQKENTWEGSADTEGMIIPIKFTPAKK